MLLEHHEQVGPLLITVQMYAKVYARLMTIPGLRSGVSPAHACLSLFTRSQHSCRLPPSICSCSQSRKQFSDGESSQFQMIRCRKEYTMSNCPVPSLLFRSSELGLQQRAWSISRLFGHRMLSKGIDSVRKSQDEPNAISDSSFNSYKTLVQPHTHTLEVKRSKFIAVAAPVSDETAALSFLSQVRDTSASHNCWAFKVGERSRFSDDGEPGGTAGRPMLRAITSSGIDHVMVVVTRIFGGTKLGTGGLVRAYGKVTTACLKNASTITIKAKASIKLRAPYDVLGILYPLLQTYAVEKLEELFDTRGGGGVTMDLQVDLEKLQLLQSELEVTCKGRAVVSHVERAST